MSTQALVNFFKKIAPAGSETLLINHDPHSNQRDGQLRKCLTISTHPASRPHAHTFPFPKLACTLLYGLRVIAQQFVCNGSVDDTLKVWLVGAEVVLPCTRSSKDEMQDQQSDLKIIFKNGRRLLCGDNQRRAYPALVSLFSPQTNTQ